MARLPRVLGKAVMRLLVTAVLVLGTMTHGTPSIGLPYVWHGGTRWPVDQAAQLWNANGVVRFYPVASCTGRPRCVDIWAKYRNSPTVVAITVMSVTHPIVVFDRRYNDQPIRVRRQAACHELGHVLGLMHRYQSCMRSVADGHWTRPNPTDLALVRSLW